MQLTDSDKRLLMTLPRKVEEMRQNIRQGEPYVWKFRLSLADLCELESAIGDSISSHAGNHEHLLMEDFALAVVIYLAEWYKRCYSAGNAEDKAIDLNTEQLKTLWRVSGINIDKYVYATADGSRRLCHYSIIPKTPALK